RTVHEEGRFELQYAFDGDHHRGKFAHLRRYDAYKPRRPEHTFRQLYLHVAKRDRKYYVEPQEMRRTAQDHGNAVRRYEIPEVERLAGHRAAKRYDRRKSREDQSHRAERLRRDKVRRPEIQGDLQGR